MSEIRDRCAGMESARAKMFPKQMSDERNLDAIEKLLSIAQEAGLSLIHMAMVFTVAHPGVTSAIIGPRFDSARRPVGRAAKQARRPRVGAPKAHGDVGHAQVAALEMENILRDRGSVTSIRHSVVLLGNSSGVWKQMHEFHLPRSQWIFDN